MSDNLNIPKLKAKNILGITGGIGCGKTTVTNQLATKGIEIIDADLVARKVVEPNSKGLNALVNEFGGQILQQDKTLDRAKLRQIAFESDNAKDTLNNILHPLIRIELLNQLTSAKSQYSVLSAPLLFENNLHTLTKINALVDIPVELQISRTLERDASSSEETIKSIIKAQMPREEKIKLSDIILDNSKDKQYLMEQVDALHLKMINISSEN